MKNLLDRITSDPAKCGGKPCIRGMRIRVSDILDMLAENVSAETILADFPDLEAEDIQACLPAAPANDTGAYSFTDAQKNELDRRLASYERNPDDIVSLQEVMASVSSNLALSK